jgi:hypothetical protein
MDYLLLYTKLNALPENMKTEVSDFIDFLVVKANKKPSNKKPQFGSGKGKFKMKPNFDEPIDYM